MADIGMSSMNYMESVPAERLKSVTKLHILLALVCSYFMPYGMGTSMLLAVLGLLAVIASSMELLNLYLALTPPSIILDIIRLGTWQPHPKSFAFVVLLMTLIMILKLAGSYFAFNIKRGVTQQS